MENAWFLRGYSPILHGFCNPFAFIQGLATLGFQKGAY